MIRTRQDITDFSSKDSREYEASVDLYNDALDEVDSDLLNFEDASACRDRIPTRLRRKTHNSVDFLDEDKISRRKMNADTSAIQELAEKYEGRFNEGLMFGATQKDLENEVTQGGLGLDLLKVFKKHNITGEAIWDSIKILKNLIGADPDILEAIETLKAKTNDKSEEVTDDENTEIEDDVEDDSVDESDTNDDENIEEALDEDSTNLKLSEQLKSLKRALAERNLRKMLSK